MVEVVTYIYLIFTFIALYMFSFFIILTIRNYKRLFYYPEPNMNYFISVIVPAYNEEDSIEDTIRHVYNSDYPEDKLEVIVVNDGSKDGTSKIVKGLMRNYKNLQLIDKENSGKADSLNKAIALSNGELVAVVDSDSFPGKESLKKLTGYFRDENMGAVTSFVRVRNRDKNYLAKIQSLEYLIMGWSRKLLDFVDSVYVTNGPLSLYRKKYISEVGGFDLNTLTEDIDITWNMLDHGYKTGMCLDADVTTVAPIKYGAWFRQRTRWGIGGLQALKKYRRMFFRKGMFGAFILPFVSFSIVLSLATFIFSLYIIFKALMIRILSAFYSVSANTVVFRFEDINLLPSVIIFYFVILFGLSMSYSWFILNTTGYEKKLTIIKFFNLIYYLIVYLTIYPLIWFSSIYRFLRKDFKW